MTVLPLALALGSCDRSTPADEAPPVLAGAMSVRQWARDAVCEREVSFTGVPYEGDCEGCTYAFYATLATPDLSCGSLPVFSWDADDVQTFLIEFSPEGWGNTLIEPAYGGYHYYSWQRIEEVVSVVDDGDWFEDGTWDPWGYLYASNAMDGQSVAFDGSTLTVVAEWESSEPVDVEEHLWEECGAAVAPGAEGVASVPAEALTIEAPGDGHVREWRYVVAVTSAAELRASAVAPRGAPGEGDIAVYVVDPDGCLSSQGAFGGDCPSDDEVCASTATDVTRPGAWSVVVGVGGSESKRPVSFAVWATLDGEVAPLLPQEAEHPVWTAGEVVSGQSLTLGARVNLQGGTTTEVPGCDLAEVATTLAGAGAVDCGVVPPWGDRSEVDACTVRSFTAGTPFVAVYEYEGMTTGATRAVVGTASGAYLLSTRRVDEETDGAVGVYQVYCEEPIVMTGGAGEDVVGCPWVDRGACESLQSTCSVEPECG